MAKTISMILWTTPYGLPEHSAPRSSLRGRPRERGSPSGSSLFRGWGSQLHKRPEGERDPQRGEGVF